MRLTFDGQHVRKLLEFSLETETPRLTFSDLVDPANLRDDLPADRRGELQAEAARDGHCFSAKPEDIDRSKIARGVTLVGDDGVYIMSQAPSEDLAAAEIEPVCYARECNPKVLDFDEWWQVKRQTFGPDDGTETLPADALRELGDDTELHIEFSGEAMQISIVQPGPAGPGQ